MSYPEWAVLERVALRGMTVTEAAAALGIDRGEALRLLHRGMLAAGGCLSGERQAGDDAQTVRARRSRRRSRRRRPATMRRAIVSPSPLPFSNAGF